LTLQSCTIFELFDNAQYHDLENVAYRSFKVTVNVTVLYIIYGPPKANLQRPWCGEWTVRFRTSFVPGGAVNTNYILPGTNELLRRYWRMEALVTHWSMSGRSWSTSDCPQHPAHWVV